MKKVYIILDADQLLNVAPLKSEKKKFFFHKSQERKIPLTTEICIELYQKKFFSRFSSILFSLIFLVGQGTHVVASMRKTQTSNFCF